MRFRVRHDPCAHSPRSPVSAGDAVHGDQCVRCTPKRLPDIRTYAPVIVLGEEVCLGMLAGGRLT